MDGPDPVDDSGVIDAVDPPELFRGVAQLGALAASSETARRCHVTRWLQFFTHPEISADDALGRDVDAESFAQSYAAFVNSGYNLRALVAAIATSPSLLP